MRNIKSSLIRRTVLLVTIIIGTIQFVSAEKINSEARKKDSRVDSSTALSLENTKPMLSFFDKIIIEIAERDFKNESYTSAIRRYEHIVSKGDTLTFLVKRLAESYMKINQFEESEFWFQEFYKTNLMSVSDLSNFAEVLKTNEKYEQASDINKKHTNLVGFSTESIQKLKSDSLRYNVSLSSVNSEASDMSPSYIDGQIVFASARKKTLFNRTNRRNEEPYLDLYCANLNTNGTLDSVVPFGNRINTKYHEATASYCESEDAIYYTTNYSSLEDIDEGKVNNLRIVRAEKTGKSWGKFEVLPFNNPAYSYAHPSVSADGKQLYFSSNMPGGMGETDIYVCNKVDGKWSDPINLGETINTKGDEMFPYIYNNNNNNNNKTLYFSSNSKLGLGGLDIYYSKIEDGSYSKSKNMGYPVNSSRDDFGLVLVGNRFRGFISSNRSKTGKDDIYSIKITPVAPKARNDYFVMDAKEVSLILNPLTNDSQGDAERITLANYTAKSSHGGQFEQDQKTGLYKYTCPIDFVGVDTISYELAYDLPYISEKCVAKVIVNVNSEEKELKEELDNFLAEVFFDFDKSNIREDADRIITNEIITFMNKHPEMQFTLSAYTDALGADNYNLKLSESRAEAVLAYLKNAQVDISRIEINFYGEQQAEQVDYSSNRGELQSDRKVQMKVAFLN